MIVDSHCHAALSWYEPVESLLFQMEQNDVEHAVLIQMMGQTDNAYLFECVRRFPGRFAPVVLVDANRADAVAELERLAAQGASGVRFRPTTRSPSEDPLAIWRAAERLGLAVSCMGTSAEFAAPDFAALVGALPALRIVVEHLGATNRPESDADHDALRRRVFELARFPNVYVKVPGLGEYCRRALPVAEPFPFEEPIPPYLEWAYARFGPERMMWGSDYPPVSVREGYRNALRFPQEQLAGKSEADRRLIFGEVARSVFPVRG